MRYVLENDKLRVEIDSFGAELKSVKDKVTNQEYMWQGDPTFWGRTSPVLFPFVGSLKDATYHHEGTSYKMGQHGFARDMEHELISQTDSAIYFKLNSNEETLKKYPFSFVLKIAYQLEGNSVKVLWEVENNSTDKQLHFSIGAHPAFNCPIYGEENKAGYKFYFANVKEIHHHGHTDTGLSIEEDILLPLDDHRVTITPEFFDGSTYIIEGRQTNEVALEDPKGNRIVSVSFDMPLFALWSPPGKNAPFVCIEPWCGRCDAADFEGSLSERAFNNALDAGEIFQTSYTMKFF
ncbi:MAG: aldose 1-epimerase family protein [Agathobacter sp.]|nr:aldose 1-epimerase family protein [Agathobacter sp.]